MENEMSFEESKALEFCHDENRRLRRALRRNRWFWRVAAGGTMMAAVMVAVHESKKTEEEQ